MGKPIVEPSSTILLTGVTGLIGGELVRRLLRTHSAPIYCLVRPGLRGDARARLIERLHLSDDEQTSVGLAAPSPSDPQISAGDSPWPDAGPAANLQALAGDVALPRFGLSDQD